MHLLSFNQLLDKAGLPPGQTRLVRHQGGRGALGKTPADLWRLNDCSFERYLEYQSDAAFGDAKYLATFIPGPAGETLFVGLYRVVSKAMVTDASWTCPMGGHSVMDHHWYTTERMHLLDAYVGRLVIEWGLATRTWVQYADRQDKTILEVRKHITEPEYPGHIHLISTIRSLDELPFGWRSHLMDARGIYLLVSHKTGQHYVGSATGIDGFWGRWQEYVRNGHGGNEMMKEAAEEDYQVSILEVAASSASESDILHLEYLWMKKLMTTTNGLNSPTGKKAKQKV